MSWRALPLPSPLMPVRLVRRKRFGRGRLSGQAHPHAVAAQHQAGNALEKITEAALAVLFKMNTGVLQQQAELAGQTLAIVAAALAHQGLYPFRQLRRFQGRARRRFRPFRPQATFPDARIRILAIDNARQGPEQFMKLAETEGPVVELVQLQLLAQNGLAHPALAGAQGRQPLVNLVAQGRGQRGGRGRSRSPGRRHDALDGNLTLGGREALGHRGQALQGGVALNAQGQAVQLRQGAQQGAEGGKAKLFGVDVLAIEQSAQIGVGNPRRFRREHLLQTPENQPVLLRTNPSPGRGRSASLAAGRRWPVAFLPGQVLIEGVVPDLIIAVAVAVGAGAADGLGGPEHLVKFVVAQGLMVDAHGGQQLLEPVAAEPRGSR